MPSAEIIAIGSELLLGETLDTNTQFLLQNLRSAGIDVFRTMIIGDNTGRISEVIRGALSRADIVITTGGLGPTIDDPTRAAVASAYDCDLVYKPELWEEIEAYFVKMQRTPTLNNKRQAYIPSLAEAISNPTGTAPAFYVYRDEKLLVSLPGVPREMKYLFTHAVVPLLDRYFRVSGKIVMRNLHSYGIGESAIDELVGDLEKTKNPSLGLCAKQGQIDLRITAKADDEETAQKMADSYEKILYEKLGKAIFGRDDDTLFSVVNRMLADQKTDLRILEINTSGKLCDYFSSNGSAETKKISTDDPEPVIRSFIDASKEGEMTVVLAFDVKNNDFVRADVYVKQDGKTLHYDRSYNLLTFDENDGLLWSLNAIRMMLLDRAN